MTREEQRFVREMKKAIEKGARPNCKKFGYKKIADFIYKVVNEYLYVLIITVPPIGLGKQIGIKLWCKPIAIDDMFWDAFEMAEEAKTQPFSFHVQGAFTPYFHTLKEWHVEISSTSEVDSVYEKIFLRADELLEKYEKSLQTINDFKQELLDTNSPLKLNIILCEMCEGNYKEALECVNEALKNHESGGFAAGEDCEDIYEYVKRYCEARI